MLPRRLPRPAVELNAAREDGAIMAASLRRKGLDFHNAAAGLSRDAVMKLGAVELGMQTIESLAACLERNGD